MRTTVTIDDHLLAAAKSSAAKQRRTLSDVLNDALRLALSTADQRRPPVDFPVFGNPQERPLVDILDKEALAEALGDNEWPRRDT